MDPAQTPRPTVYCVPGGTEVKFDVGILGSQPVPTIVRQAQLAEALGYDTVWITDTHLICRELWVTLTACALRTSRIRLGPGSPCRTRATSP